MSRGNVPAQRVPPAPVAEGCRAAAEVPVAKLVLAAIGISAAIAAAWLLPVREWLEFGVDWLDGRGTVAMVVFAFAYALFATVGVPTTPFVIAAGVLFGTGRGFVSAQAGAITAAVVSFLIARHVAQGWMRRQFACRPKYKALLELVGEQGWKMVVMTRLNPLLPASVKNYGFGLTDVRLITYVSATLAVQAPVILLYTYLGSLGKLTLEGGGSLDKVDYLLCGAGLLAAVTHVVLVTRYSRRKLREVAPAETIAG